MLSTFFMHSPVQKKYAVKTAYGARGVGEKISPTRLHTGTQRKDVSRADGYPARREGNGISLFDFVLRGGYGH